MRTSGSGYDRRDTELDYQHPAEVHEIVTRIRLLAYVGVDIQPGGAVVVYELCRATCHP